MRSILRLRRILWLGWVHESGLGDALTLTVARVVCRHSLTRLVRRRLLVIWNTLTLGVHCCIDVCNGRKGVVGQEP